MILERVFVYMSAEHSYTLEAPSPKFVINEYFNADRTRITDLLDITEFPCLVMLSYGDGMDDNPTATTLPIALLQCDEPEVEYEEEEETDGNLRAGNPENYLAFD